MKKLILIIILVCPLILFAQDVDNKEAAWKFEKGHELRVGLGYMPFDPSFVFNLDGYHSMFGYGHYTNYSIGETMSNPTTYRARQTQWGSAHLSYTYRFTKWFELSAVASFSLTTGKRCYNTTNETCGNDGVYVFSLSPSARFVWLRREKITLYSSINAGLCAGTDNGYGFISPSFNLNYFGMTVGRQVYWFLDLSVGNLGLVSSGVGVRI